MTLTSVSSRLLIVGAGPTGLTLANTLKRCGVAFDIIDAKSGLSTDSKGLSLNVSSQLVFSFLNIRDRVAQQGYPIRNRAGHEPDQGRPDGG